MPRRFHFSVLVLLSLGVLAPATGTAETIRVAVARGAAIEVEAEGLRGLPAGDDAWVALGRASRFEAVGPLVSNGELLTPRLVLEAAAGGRIVVKGVALLGAVEILATDKGLVAVDEVELEDYVASVVGGEMPASWPASALEAQAIAARTYALRRRESAGPSATFHVEATVVSQVYAGARSLDARTRAATDATRGQVLNFGGALADAFFFSSCRTRTESGEAAFGQGAPYLKPVSCDGGEAAPMVRWTRRVALGRASSLLEARGAIGGPLRRVDVESRTSSGRIATVRLLTRRGSRVMGGPEFRQLLGWTELPSLDAKITLERGDLVFTGGGAGHGVGLCQWCARGRATRGESASEILAHFYPGTVLERRP